MFFIFGGGNKGGGQYTRFPEVEKCVRDLKARETLWRAQEAKILKILDWCKNAAPEDENAFAAVMDKTCSMLETSKDYQSPLIMEAIKDIIRESNAPAIHGRAAQCHARMDWGTALDDANSQKVMVMSSDKAVKDAFEEVAKRAVDKATVLEPALSGSNDGARKDTAAALVRLGLEHPTAAKLVKCIFAAVAGNDSAPVPVQRDAQAACLQLAARQNENVGALVRALNSAPAVSRPRLIVL